MATGGPSPKPAKGGGKLRGTLQDRMIQGLLAAILWWAVYYRVDAGYGQGAGIIAATCAAWLFVLVGAYAVHLLNQYAARANGPRGPQPPRGRWPGAPP